MRRKDKQKYNYKQYTLMLDLDIAEDKKMSEFLEDNRDKRNNFNDQIKQAIKLLMAKKGE